MVARSVAGSLRGRTGATSAGQAALRRRGNSRVRCLCKTGPRPPRGQAETPTITASETSLLFQSMQEAGTKYAQLVEAKGQREHDLGSPHLHVFMALLSTLAAYVLPQGGGQAVLGRSSSTRRRRTWVSGSRRVARRRVTTGRSRRSRVILFATKGTMDEEGHPTPCARPRQASVRDHGEADDRAELARGRLVLARWEAQGGNGAARGERARSHARADTKDDRNRAIDSAVAGEAPTYFGPPAGRETSTYVIDGSTCLAAPRLKWSTWATRSKERTQVLVPTQVLWMACFTCSPHDYLSQLILESNAKSKKNNHQHQLRHLSSPTPLLPFSVVLEGRHTCVQTSFHINI